MPFKMSSKLKAVKTSCTKIKNPCKFCLQQVTNRNGLQCQGACKKWAHFNCLNYTPGKISDIKAGIIKVTCPCPDCETTQPKEYLVKPPYTCSNENCPANKGPKCVSEECPLNPKKESTCGNKACTKIPVSCPAVECPQTAAQVQKRSHPRLQPARPPTPPRSGSKGSKGSKKSASNSPCRSPKVPKTCSPPPPPCPVPKPCPPEKPKKPTCPEKPKKPACPEKPKKKEKCKKKPAVSPSCSVLSSNSNCPPPQKKCSSSDSNLSRKAQAQMVQAVQEMCNTVGKLSNQLKELMCKVTQN